MKTMIYNLGYFIRETAKVFRLNLLSNIVSLLGTAMVLFLLGLVFTGTVIGDQLVTMLSEETEINLYIDQGISQEEVEGMVDQISELEGISEARLVGKEEAMGQMKGVLGEEAKILELFDENPFESYIQASIEIDAIDTISDRVKTLEGVDYIRDNRQVLEQIKGITRGIKLLGHLIIIAVGVTTIIIISHMIRQGIYNNKEQINTLRLLGAPNGFIGLPYVCFGVLLILGGSILATIGLEQLVEEIYSNMSGTLPFIPLPQKTQLKESLRYILPIIGATLGLVGSLVGLSSIREKD